MPYEIVEQFEETVAQYAGSKYAIAVDSCTNAIFLCLKYINKIDTIISIPKKTYISIPCSIRNAGYKLKFRDLNWSGVYQLKPLPIFDGALRFKKGMYKGGFHCLSFHVKKHLKIGRGGMILTDDKKARDWFRLARFNGRNPIKHKDDIFSLIGWNFYMTNYDAARGLWLFNDIPDNNQDIKTDYPDLSIYNFNDTYSGEFLKTIK